MTPEQALEILNQASALASLPRKEHELVLQALETLKKLINASKPAI